MRKLMTILVLALPLTGCINYHKDEAGEDGDSAPGIHTDADAAHDGGSTHSINGAIYVPADRPVSDVSTVNGSVRIADNGKILAAHSVNGSLTLGAHATAGSLTTVNGGVLLDEGAQVSGAVNTVNGTLTLHPGSAVGGRLSNVNGTIIVIAASVGEGINTVNGNIDIGTNAHIKGGITVHKPVTSFLHWWGDRDKPRVVVGPGATVEGELRFEREVRLYVNDTATIGPVTGATAVKFAGVRPPRG